MKIRVINKSKHPLPQYETSGASGLDLRADLEGSITINPLERVLCPTNIQMQMPFGVEAQVRPRSGLTLRKGLVAQFGTIDSDYRGCVGVILANISNEPVVVNDGDRVAQMVFSRCESIDWEQVECLEATDRGAGGFGHSGIK